MSAVKLASRYAKSLLDFAIEKGQVEEVYNDQLYLKEVIRVSRDFDLLLSNPLISPDKKLKALEAVLAGKANDLTMLYLKLLVKKSRELYLKEMVDSFLLQYDLYKHVTQVKIISAAPLSENEIDELLMKLKNDAKLETIHLKTEVDENLIGGFVLKYGDKQYDASIAKILKATRKELEENAYMKGLR